MLFVVYILVIVYLFLSCILYLSDCVMLCVVCLFYDLFHVRLSTDRTLGPMKRVCVCVRVCTNEGQ
jgi:hypothetical protein